MFLLGFLALVATAAPGLSPADAGELDTAAWSLGAARAPGAAPFVLVAKAAALLPLGNVAMRINLLSSLLAALALWMVYRAVRAIAGGVLGETCGALAALLLLAGALWRPGTVASLGAPTAAVTALALWLAVRIAGEDAGERAGAGRLLALLAGLAWGLSPSLAMGLVPPLAALSLARLRRGDRWPLLAPLAFALGAAVLLLLPLAPSQTLPGPRTASALWRFAFAGHGLEASAATVAGAAAALGRLASGLERDLGLPSLAAAGVGLAQLIARRRAVGLSAAWLIVAGAAGDENRAAASVATAFAAGAGLAWLAERMIGRGASSAGRAALVAGALGSMAVAPAAFAGASGKLGPGAAAAAWTRAALASAPPRALVLTATDDLSSGALYAQRVEGMRPDLTLLARPRLAEGEAVVAAAAWSGGALLSESDARAWAAQPERSRRRDARALLARVVAHELRVGTILWEPGDDPPPSGALTPGTPLFHLDSAPAPPPPALPLAERIGELIGSARDPEARRIEATALRRLGEHYAAKGDDAHAGPLFQLALDARTDDASALTRLAEVKARRGDVDGALALVARVLARPDAPLEARLDAGNFHLAIGDLDGAERDFQRARRDDPGDPVSALVGLARVAHARGDDAAARRWVEEALTAAPTDEPARKLATQLGP